MVEEAVENGGGDGGVAVEDGGPLLEGLVGGEHDGTAFVACADDLEQEVCPALIDGQVADLIEDQKRRGRVFAQLGFERPLGLGGVEGVDDIDGVGEEDAHALLAGSVAEGRGEMGFAESDEAQEDDVGFIVDELEAEQILDLEPVDFLWPVPEERVEGFDDREPGGLDAPRDGAVGPEGGLAFDELCQIVEMGEGVFGGGGGKRPAMLLEERQAQCVETGVEFGDVGFHGLS